MKHSRQSSGFTLLEIIIAVAILAILAGMAMPLAGKAFESKARTATRAECAQLAEAVGLFVYDTLSFPVELEDLWLDPGDVDDWTGPYLPYTTIDPLSEESDWTVDAWSRDYALDVTDDVLTLTSGGPDGTVGTSDDIEFEVAAAPFRRERTLEQLDIINAAVQAYNDQNLPDTPLPTDYDDLLDELVDAYYLPAVTGYQTDAWGDSFQPTPTGETPVVEIGSINLGGD